MGAGTEDVIGLEPARHGGTAGSGTSPGYLAAPGHHLRPVHYHTRQVAQITWLAGRRGAGGAGVLQAVCNKNKIWRYVRHL